jgi:hypothetical protein
MAKKQVIKLIIFLVLTLILIILLDFIYSSYSNKIKFQNSILSQTANTSIFSTDKIVFFSSCNASSTVNANSTITIKDLYQYSDIAIFINNSSNNETFTLENTLKEIYIENISFITPPYLGKPSLYTQTLNNFASGTFLQENKITDLVNFDISSDDVIDYSSSALHNNCATPITLCYVNSNIINDYTISNTENITYDGSLLNVCNIPAKNLECSMSFDIYIVNNLNQKFKCPIYIEIPLSGEDSSIYDGSYVFEKTTNFIFYQIL